MRVCYITNQAISTSGWGRYSVEVIKAMCKLDITPVLVSASPEVDPALRNIEHHPILEPVLVRQFNTLFTLKDAPKLRKIIQSCDAVHCFVELYAPLVALAAPRQTPFFLNAHGTWAIRPLETFKSKIVFAPAVKRADTVICLSRFTHDWMKTLIDLPHAVVLTGGVTPEIYQQEVKAALPEWVGRDLVALSPAGAFKPRKGQHVTVEAIALARQQLPNLHYVMTGRVDERLTYIQDIKKRVRDLGLEDWVHFTGVVSEEALIAWYQKADVLLQTPINEGSSFEGLGLIYLEAAAAGTPSIGSQNCGAIDAIIEGETGFLVPQNDPQATAEALVKLLKDADLREKMSAAARQHAENMTWDKLAQHTFELYQEKLNSDKRE